MSDERFTAIYKKIEELEQTENWLAIKEQYASALKLSEQIYGENHKETLAILTEYGGLLRNLGEYDLSEKMLQRALVCCQFLKGSHHPDYASALVNMANLFRMMKHYEKSESFFLQAQSIYEATIGTENESYASLCNNLGLLYQDLGNWKQAILLHNQSLTIIKSLPHHELLYGITLNNLVEPLRQTGKEKEALSILGAAIRIFREQSAARSLLAASLNNKGTLYFMAKEYGLAMNLFYEAASISKEYSGENSEGYLSSKANYNKAMHIIHKKCSAIQESAKGLEISEAYFFDVIYPILQNEFSQYLPRIAAGLIGEGSECYGFDDLISRDHDFGPSYQIFIPKEDFPVYGNKLNLRLSKVSANYRFFNSRNTSEYGEGRVGIFSIEDFYDKYLSMHQIPSSNRIWIQLDDIPLSTATNGKVFIDNLGQFSQIRNGLLKHYPRDIQIKKLAYHCMMVAQSGQYNLPRSLKREQYISAYHCINEFITNYAAAIYLLNKTYRPYYKWEQEGLKTLPVLGKYTCDELEKLIHISLKENADFCVYTIESMCGQLILKLKEQGFTDSPDDFLLNHGPLILQKAKDHTIRESNPWLIR